MDTEHPQDDPTTPPDLPASMVPRWLALLVLIALLSAAAYGSYAVLTIEGPRHDTPAAPAP